MIGTHAVLRIRQVDDNEESARQPTTVGSRIRHAIRSTVDRQGFIVSSICKKIRAMKMSRRTSSGKLRSVLLLGCQTARR